jgi:hypothetical protein
LPANTRDRAALINPILLCGLAARPRDPRLQCRMDAWWQRAGLRVEALFLRSLSEGDFTAVELTRPDYARMADLVLTYSSLP